MNLGCGIPTEYARIKTGDTVSLSKPDYRFKFNRALLDIAPSTANRLIADFQKEGILEELTGFKRNRKFIFREYFEIFQK